MTDTRSRTTHERETAPLRPEHIHTFFGRWSFPLYSMEGDRETPWGTAFLISHQHQIFLISAAHVLARRKTHVLFYYGPNASPVGLRGDILSDTNSGVDIGVMPIRGNDLPAYCAPMEMDVLGDPHDAAAAPRPMLVGYPVSRNKIRRIDNVVRASSAAFVCEWVPSQRYSQLGYDQSKHIVLEHDPKKVEDVNGVKLVPPAPQGLSGSPIFSVPNPIDLQDARSLRVVGLITEQNTRKTLLVGQNHKFIRQMVHVASLHDRFHRQED